MGDTVLYYMLAAFVGGLILNVMPCVLPVLTMKVFHVIEQTGQEPRKTRIHGLAYTGGIVATFLLMAGIVIALRASGERMGWGMQFQSPAFVATMCALIFAFGLNAMGVFEIAISVQGGGKNEGYSGSFINGVLASVMATPCSAPFLGSAASFALGSGAAAWQTLLMFLLIGFGLAFPFLVISFVPAVAKVLPRPGAWMETFKKLMGFTLMAAAIWLFGVLQAQVTNDSSLWFLGFLLVLGVALWGIEHWGGLMHGLTRRLSVRVGAALVVVLAATQMIQLDKASASQAANASTEVVVGDHINWAGFNSCRVAAEQKRARPIFMDFTADWCLDCKTNEKAFIEVSRVRETLKKTQILPMKADMTDDDEEMEQWLEKLGRSGIPAYVIYMPDGTYDLLPEAITTDMLEQRLAAASKRFPPEKFAESDNEEEQEAVARKQCKISTKADQKPQPAGASAAASSEQS